MDSGVQDSSPCILVLLKNIFPSTWKINFSETTRSIFYYHVSAHKFAASPLVSASLQPWWCVRNKSKTKNRNKKTKQYENKG